MTGCIHSLDVPSLTGYLLARSSHGGPGGTEPLPGRADLLLRWSPPLRRYRTPGQDWLLVPCLWALDMLAVWLRALGLLALRLLVLSLQVLGLVPQLAACLPGPRPWAGLLTGFDRRLGAACDRDSCFLVSLGSRSGGLRGHGAGSRYRRGPDLHGALGRLA